MRDVPAAVAIAIAIVVGADAEVARAEVREAVREVTVVAAPAVVAVGAEEDKNATPAPEGRTNLAQRFSAGKSGTSDSSPGGTAEFSRTYFSPSGRGHASDRNEFLVIVRVGRSDAALSMYAGVVRTPSA